MKIRSLLRLAVLAEMLAASLAACVPFGSGAPYDHSDRFKDSNGNIINGTPGSDAR
jgi:hypothetical protein